MYEVYAYWNVVELEAMFNAVASLMGSGDYRGLLQTIAIVGATGAVGVEMIRCLEERAFPVASLTLLASARSAGKKLKFKGQELTIQELTPESFKGIDIALFSAGGGISRDFAPHAVKAAAAAATPSVKMILFVILNRFPLKGFL